MLFLDVETQNTNEEDGGFRLDKMRISYVGAIDYETKKEYDFWEKDLEQLGELMRKSGTIVGYNIFGFDMPVIANYLGYKIKELPQLDLMVAVKEKIGFRPKLNVLANATLGKGKLGSGLDAVEWYHAGELQKLRDYCMEDVRLTLEVYQYGLDHKKVKYWDKNGFVKETDIDWDLGLNYKENVVKTTDSDTANASGKTSEPEVLKMF